MSSDKEKLLFHSEHKTKPPMLPHRGFLFLWYLSCTGVRRVLTNIFGNREVLAYVTATEKEHGTKRLFFSTVFPENLQIFCACQENAPLNQTGNDSMKYIPLLLYSFRWNIETSYYEQKTFWSLCNYMVRSCKFSNLKNLLNSIYLLYLISANSHIHFISYFCNIKDQTRQARWLLTNLTFCNQISEFFLLL